MQPVVTLFKTEFLDYPQLYKQFGILPDEVKESEFFYLYSPPFRKLSEILSTLKRNGVIHGIHFEPRRSSERKPKHNIFESRLIQI